MFAESLESREYALPPISGESFDVDSYVRRRVEQEQFTLVEIGPRATPVCTKQPFTFRDGRCYIGIEANLRDPCGVARSLVNELLKAHKDENIFYINHDLGGGSQRDIDDPDGESYFVGEYDATTILPEGCADEVVISNVFCDPHIAFSPERQDALLREAGRLVADAGVVVIRDTITPRYTALSRLSYETTGLAPVGTVDYRSDEWRSLESLYDGEPVNYFDYRGYYLFLQQPATS